MQKLFHNHGALQSHANTKIQLPKLLAVELAKKYGVLLSFHKQ